MFGLMTAAAHEKAMTFARQEHERIKTKAHLERQCDHRTLDAERSITASLRAEIAELKPAADKWNAAQQKRKAARAGE